MPDSSIFSSAPYPGLRPFDTQEHDIFFGRERQTDHLVEKLASQRFLAVVGPSGCGKSSLVRAGLIASLRVGLMSPAGSRWQVLQLRPGDAPFARLASEVARATDAASTDSDAPVYLEAALRRGPLGLIEVASENDLCARSNVLVVIDQFEELFRFRDKGKSDDAEAFVALLLATAAQQDLPLYVVITMRSEFLGQCDVFYGLPERINEAQYLTPRLTREECSIAITGPAHVFQGEIEPELLNRLLNDFSSEPDQLPVLQHALMRMWTRKVGDGSSFQLPSEHSEQRTLTVADYKQIGHLSNALSEHADEAYGELSARQKEYARICFQRLVEHTPAKLLVRSPASLGELAELVGCEPAEIARVLEVFRHSDRCFLTPRAGEPLRATSLIDISHESLIRQWTRLAEWVDAESESADEYIRLKDSARMWERKRGDLWTGLTLDRASSWQNELKPTQRWASRYGTAEDFELSMKFLRESQLAREKERWIRRRQQILRRWLIVLAIAIPSALLPVYLYLYVWEYEAQFADVVRAFGAPKGIRKLNPIETEHRAVSFNIVRRGRSGPVIRMEALNGRHRPTRDHCFRSLFDDAECKETAASRWEYHYSQDGQLELEISFDLSGNQMRRINYHRAGKRVTAVLADDGERRDARRIRIEYSDKGYEAKLLYMDLNERPAYGPDRVPGKTRTYDDDGRLKKDVSTDFTGKPINDAAGNASAEYVYDTRGDLVQAVSRDALGRKSPLNKGWSLFRGTYDNFGNRIAESFFGPASVSDVSMSTGEVKIAIKDGFHRATIKYDAQGFKTQILFWDIHDHATTDLEGCHGYEYRYDDDGNRARTVCLDDHLASTSTKNGCAEFDQRFDRNGWPIDWQSFTNTRQPCIFSGGFSRMQRVVDQRGRELQREHRGLDGQLTTNTKERFARVVYKRDASGNVLETSYFGANGEPTSKDGIARRTKAFDMDGHLLEESFWGTDGRPVRHADNYHTARYRFDARGNKTEVIFLDVDGKMIVSSGGFAGKRMKYDELGNLLESCSIGPTQAAILGPEGFACTQYAYDARGRESMTKYLDAARRPVNHKTDRIAEIRYERDAVGNIVDTRYFDASGKPSMLKGTYSHKHVEYDSQSREIDIRYESIFNQPVENEDGNARIVYAYDERGDRVEQQFFDKGWIVKGAKARKKLVKLRFDDQHRLLQRVTYGREEQLEGDERFTLDQFGNVVDLALFGSQGEPVLSTRKCHRLARSYDAFGRVVAMGCYDEAGKPRLNENGYFWETVEYSDRGQERRKDYFDTEGNWRNRKEGYASVLYEYDERGNRTSEVYLDQSGSPAAREAGSAVFSEYDERGLLTKTRTVDAKSGKERVARFVYDDRSRKTETHYSMGDGSPWLVDGFAYERVTFDDDKSVQIVSYFGAQNQPVLHGKLRIHTLYTLETPVRYVRAAMGVKGELLNGANGFAITELVIEDGNRATLYYFNTNQELVGSLPAFMDIDGEFKPAPTAAWNQQPQPSAAQP